MELHKKNITVINNVNILTMNEDKDIIENGVVAFSDNKIIYVGKELEKKFIDEYEIELIDGENGILIHHSERSKYDAYIHDFKAVKRMLEIIKLSLTSVNQQI